MLVERTLVERDVELEGEGDGALSRTARGTARREDAGREDGEGDGESETARSRTASRQRLVRWDVPRLSSARRLSRTTRLIRTCARVSSTGALACHQAHSVHLRGGACARAVVASLRS